MRDVGRYDCIIVGGGLSGSLLFYALKLKNPTAKILLFEKGSVLGGNHTWCFHDSDVSKHSMNWLTPLISKSWDFYDVHFPKYSRTLNTKYHAIKSNDLHEKIFSFGNDSIFLNSEIKEITTYSVQLQNGKKFYSELIIDARGWAATQEGIEGYQKFVGLDVRLKDPHSYRGVVLKDALVSQTDGYRFFYVLPWSENELLVEDTYYSNSPDLNIENIKEEIIHYLHSKGHIVEEIIRTEVGCLPLHSKLVSNSKSLALGASSGLIHPVTGYTLPSTVKLIESFLALNSLRPNLWGFNLLLAKDKSSELRDYFYFLNKVIFRVCGPHLRYKVLEHFYRLPEFFIKDFYSMSLNRMNKYLIFLGKPPVSIKSFLKMFI